MIILLNIKEVILEVKDQLLDQNIMPENLKSL